MYQTKVLNNIKHSISLVPIDDSKDEDPLEIEKLYVEDKFT